MPLNRSRLRLSKWKKWLNITIFCHNRSLFQIQVSKAYFKEAAEKRQQKNVHQAQLLAPKAAKYAAEYSIAFVCISEGSYKTIIYFKDKKIFQKYSFLCGESVSSLIRILISQRQASVTGGLSNRQFSLLIFQLEAAEHHESF